MFLTFHSPRKCTIHGPQVSETLTGWLIDGHWSAFSYLARVLLPGNKTVMESQTDAVILATEAFSLFSSSLVGSWFLNKFVFQPSGTNSYCTNNLKPLKIPTKTIILFLEDAYKLYSSEVSNNGVSEMVHIVKNFVSKRDFFHKQGRFRNNLVSNACKNQFRVNKNLSKFIFIESVIKLKAPV